MHYDAWKSSYDDWKTTDPRDRHYSTGRRRTQDDIARCYNCGDDIDDGNVLFFDGHTFCHRACMDRWLRRDI